MQLQGCSSLCSSAPANFVVGGAAGSAAEATVTPAIDTGTARSARLLFAFAAAEGNKVVSVQFSDDGETWARCDADLTASLGDTEGKQLIAICLENSKRYLRAEVMTPNGYSVISELAGMRHSSQTACCNESSVTTSIDCDELTLIV